MKLLLKPAMAAGLALVAAGPLAVVPTAAQDLKTVGVVDLPYVMGQSNAYKTAEQQRPTYYKAQIDQAQTRSNQLKAQIQPLVDKLQADSKLPNANRATLQQQYNTIQTLNQNGQNELQDILAPVALSQEYVQEQIQDKLGEAIENAAKAKGVSLILNRENIVVYRSPSYDMNQAVTDELNKLLPVAQLVPPPGWVPREVREQQAAQQGGQPAQAGATPPAAPPANTTPAGPPANSR